MAKQHVDIFKALGIPQADIDAIEALTDDTMKDWKPDATTQAIRTLMKTSLQNDPEFLNAIPEDKIPEATKKKLESGQYARFQNELLTVAKKFGIEEKEFTDDDKKSIKGFSEKMMTLYLTKKGNVEGLQAMQKELGEVKQQLEAKEEEWKTKMETEITGVTTKMGTKLMRNTLQASLGSIPGVKLKVGPNVMVDTVMGRLAAKFSIVMKDNDELDIMNKENNKLEAQDKSGKKIPFTQALKEVVIEDGLGEEVKIDDKKPGDKKKVIIGSDEGGGEGDAVVVPDYIQQNIDRVKAAEEATK